MIRVIYVPNPLVFDQRQCVEYSYDRKRTVHSYLTEFAKDCNITWDENSQVRIVVSGKRIHDLQITLNRGDEITLCTEILAAPVIFGVTVTFAKLMTALYYVAQVTMIAYGIFSSFQKPRKPSYGINNATSGGGIDDGSVYGWNGIHTTQDVGIPIPVIYGRHKVGGNILNAYLSYDGDLNYLNVLLGLGEGEIYGVTDIKINNNPVANFDDVTTDMKVGTNLQTPIEGFEDAHNSYDVNVNLNELDDSHVYTTIDSDVEAFELHFQNPQGLYSITIKGGLGSHDVTYQVEYKLHTDPSYTDLGDTKISAETRSVVRRVFRKSGLTPGQYDIKVTRKSSSGDLQHIDALTWTQIDEIKTENYAYPNTALLSVKAMANDQLSGAMPNFSCIVKGKKISIPKIMNGIVEVDWEDYYWDPDTEEYKLFSDNTVLSWDESTYVERWSANPIWCFKDMLGTSRYGLGRYVEVANMNNASFLEMSQYCDEKMADGAGGYEKRFYLDVVLGGSGKAPDVISQLAAVFRGLPFYSNGVINLQMDKPSDPVQMFTMGNIIKDSFVQGWKTYKEIPNVIEIQYLDQDKDYEQELIAYDDSAALAAGDPMRKKTIRVFTTRKSQAVREARYALKLAKYARRVISFKAGIDAITCQGGDVISIAHDVPQWGESGRVESGTVSTITLDREIIIETGETYYLRIQLANDDVEERTVNNAPGTTNVITVVTPFSTAPANYDKYSVGTINLVKRDFRVIDITRDNKMEVQINGLLYDENVYDDTDIDLPTDNFDSPTEGIPLVSNLSLTERVKTNSDGTIESAIDVWFTKPDIVGYSPVNRFKGVNVYVRSTTDMEWTYAGYTERDHMSIVGNLTVGITYYVCVTSMSFAGNETSKGGAPNDNITLTGKTTKPANVTGFVATFTEELILGWNKITDGDLAGYEIRNVDNSWGTDNANLVYRGTTNNFIYRPSTRSPGTLYIRAFNTSGTYSDASVNVIPSNTVPTVPTSFTSVVFFNVAKLTWENIIDADIIAYQVYRSETNAWTGEEVLETEIAGRSVVVKARKPVGGATDSSTNTTIVDSDLIGNDDDFCVGDIIEIMSGANKGEVRTITGFVNSTGTITVSVAWTINPSATDKFIIYDRSYFKVRAVDSYGAGAFTSAMTVTFETLTEDSLGDEVITARKLTTGELITLSAQIKDAIITNVKILDGEITASKLDVTQLSAIAANMGTLDVDEELTIGDNMLIDGVNELLKVYGDTVSIETGINDELDWVEDSTTYNATLTAGEYTPVNLAAHIQVKMRAVGDNDTLVTYSTSTRKITIGNSTLSTLTLKWSTGTNTVDTCGRALGFDVTADDTGSLNYVADEETAIRIKLGKLS